MFEFKKLFLKHPYLKTSKYVPHGNSSLHGQDVNTV